MIGLIDGAGLRLQELTDALEAFGVLPTTIGSASGVIPQVTAIFGMCGGGLAVVPGLTDFTFMEAKTENFSLILQMHWKEMRFPSVTQQALSTRARQQVL